MQLGENHKEVQTHSRMLQKSIKDGVGARDFTDQLASIFKRSIARACFKAVLNRYIHKLGV
jgi:hypothetical protein